jgi:hypothetical protein
MGTSNWCLELRRIADTLRVSGLNSFSATINMLGNRTDVLSVIEYTVIYIICQQKSRCLVPTKGKDKSVSENCI